MGSSGSDPANPREESDVTWMIESIRDADVAPADVFRLYTDPSTWRVGLRYWAPHERFDLTRAVLRVQPEVGAAPDVLTV